ncbi:MAG: recombinase family protein [Candidatus Omnitrophota bacterium]
MEQQEKKKIACAIYTRVSTTERLEQEFTSLDNQRESAESYIQSQKSEGWVALPDRYDDPGYTGANTERPALQKLMADIKESKINCVVVYKVDRLSRSLLDFSQLLESFEQNNVTFVSVTQAFNTNTSMGRLTLNILLSFAQFEREIISERTRDKMAASKKRGKWVGGRPPLGYDIDKVNRKLIINTKEAELVKEIFDLYLEKRSLLSVAIALNEKNRMTKNYTTLEGRKSGGVKFKSTSIQSIVKNPFYIGKVGHAGVLYQGEQERVISDDIFQKAQEILANNRRERKIAGVANIGLLNSILRCKACDSTMYYIYSKKGANKYHYYLCMNAQKRGYKNCPTRLIPAQVTENKFMEFLRTICKDPRIEANAWEKLTLEEKIPILRSIAKVAHYDAVNGTLEMVLHKAGRTCHQFALKLAELKHIPYHRQQAEITKEPPIRQNLILGYQISEVIKEKGCSIEEIANWLGIIRPRLCQFINMLLLSPKIQEEILLSEEKTIFNIPEYKLRDIIAEVDWNAQQKLWNNLIESHQK